MQSTQTRATSLRPGSSIQVALRPVASRFWRSSSSAAAAAAFRPAAASAGWQVPSRALVRTNAKGGTLDAPVKESVTEKSKELQKKKRPVYKVLLHNDNYNRREYVVKVLLKVVKIIGPGDAVNVMQEAHETGVGMVIACPQEDAETYCEGLRLNGLTSTIEPGC